jgi:tol-pal system protein YbgF
MTVLRAIGVTALCALVAFFSGCVTSGEYINVRNEVNQLKKNYYAQDKDIAVIKKELENVKAGVPRGAGQESFSAIRDNQEQLNTQVSSLAKDVQVLQGRFDESKFSLEKSVKDNSLEFDILRSRMSKLEEDVTSLKGKMAELQASLSKKAPELSSAEGKKEEKTAPPSHSVKGDPKDLYAAAYDNFKNGDYKKAREGFSDFLKKYPDNELADNANFWIGEAYFKEKDYENAILAYEKLMKEFPKSPKLPAAMFKQAKSFEAIGDEKTAKVIYQLLSQRYPDSAEAKSLKGKVPAKQ